MGITICFINQKGGCGKSSTCFHLAGVLAQSIGWPSFFVVSALLALPSLVLLWVMREAVRRLEGPLAEPAATPTPAA